MGTFDAAARVLAAGGARPADLGWARFEPLPPSGEELAPVTAVDGSHAVLVDNGAAWVVAHRVGTVRWPGPPAARLPPTVTAARPADAAALAGDAPPPRSAEALAALLRARAESGALLAAIEAAPAGGLVLCDGALRGLPDEAQAAADATRAAARRRGVCLVGVAKRSGVDRGGVPLVPALQAAGPAGAWAVRVDDGVFVARLHPAAPHAFRVDADRLQDVTRLAPLARDAAYLGYPYPLAKAHNLVALAAAEVAELQGGLERALRREGAGAALAARDFHDVLDRNVPG